MAEPKAGSAAAAARRALYEAQKKAGDEHMGLPSLHLLIWPTRDAVRLSLVIYYSRPGMRRTCKVLRSAEWNPKEVTERTLIDWGQRAMAAYLQDLADGKVKQQ